MWVGGWIWCELWRVGGCERLVVRHAHRVLGRDVGNLDSNHKQPGLACTRSLCISLCQALDAAKGMHYLHEHSPPIIHRWVLAPALQGRLV